jgi:hypothetical protein
MSLRLWSKQRSVYVYVYDTFLLFCEMFEFIHSTFQHFGGKELKRKNENRIIPCIKRYDNELL